MNPVSVLNELRQGLVYNVKSQTGPDHEPDFTVTVEVYSQIYYSMRVFPSSISPYSQVDGEHYLGQGRSKKIARVKAAEAALVAHNTKRTSDSLSVMFSYRKLNDDQCDFVSSNNDVGRSTQKPQNPIVVLNELRPGVFYKLNGRRGPDHDPVFTVTVEVIDYSFQLKAISNK